MNSEFFLAIQMSQDDSNCNIKNTDDKNGNFQILDGIRQTKCWMCNWKCWLNQVIN